MAKRNSKDSVKRNNAIDESTTSAADADADADVSSPSTPIDVEGEQFNLADPNLGSSLTPEGRVTGEYNPNVMNADVVNAYSDYPGLAEIAGRFNPKYLDKTAVSAFREELNVMAELFKNNQEDENITEAWMPKLAENWQKRVDAAPADLKEDFDRITKKYGEICQEVEAASEAALRQTLSQPRETDSPPDAAIAAASEPIPLPGDATPDLASLNSAQPEAAAMHAAHADKAVSSESQKAAQPAKEQQAKAQGESGEASPQVMNVSALGMLVHTVGSVFSKGGKPKLAPELVATPATSESVGNHINGDFEASKATAEASVHAAVQQFKGPLSNTAFGDLQHTVEKKAATEGATTADYIKKVAEAQQNPFANNPEAQQKFSKNMQDGAAALTEAAEGARSPDQARMVDRLRAKIADIWDTAQHMITDEERKKLKEVIEKLMEAIKAMMQKFGLAPKDEPAPQVARMRRRMSA